MQEMDNHRPDDGSRALDELDGLGLASTAIDRLVVGERKAGRQPGGAPSSRRVALELLTTKEVAQILRVRESTVRSWRVANYGPRWTRIGKRCLYKTSDVERWFEDQRRLTEGARRRLERQHARKS